jgi:hypothetical protein
MGNEKIILDTNLWISFLISKNFSQLDELIENKNITLVFSNELLEEFIEVVRRPKFKKYLSEEDIANLLNYFDLYSKIIEVKSDVQLCRDQKDNFLLNLSIDSKAHFLITGDKDLLVLKRVQKTKIISFRDFLKHTK